MQKCSFLNLFEDSRSSNFIPLMEGYSFSCLMALVPESMSESIKRYQSIIEPSDVCHDGDCKGLEDEFHITILYGIIDKSPEKAKSLVKDKRAFRVKLGKISLFENTKYDVLKVDVESPDLHELNKLIKENMDFEEKFPDYHPHLTIGYLKSGSGKIHR